MNPILCARGRTGSRPRRPWMLGLVAAGLAHAPGALACSCARPTVEDLIRTRPDVAIFVARVASILAPEKGGPTVTRFAVEDVIRGDVPAVVEMTGITFQDEPCGADLRVGEVRTVAATRTTDGRWTTSACLMPRP